MPLLSVIGDGIKEAGHTATGIASGLAQGAVNLFSGMWKMAFGEETGALVNPVAEGAGTLVRGAEGIANAGVNAAVGAGESLISGIGSFSPPAPMTALPPGDPQRGK